MNQKLEAFRDAIRGKTVSVVGLGISNTPVIDFLLSCGAVVVGRDKKTEVDYLLGLCRSAERSLHF